MQQDELDGLPLEGRARYAVLDVLQRARSLRLDWVDAASDLEGGSGDPGWPGALAGVFDELGADAALRAWEWGWMPREALSALRKSLSPEAVRAGAVMMRGQLARYRDMQLSDRWNVQREELAAIAPFAGVAKASAGLGRWDRIVLWGAVLEALDFLSGLPKIPKVEPLPGDLLITHGLGVAESSRVYEKIRALLAKAESTDSDAEAEAFTAKAQQLIARHSINEALLSEAGQGKRDPEALRVIIERPYEQPKSELLAQIADANHCRSVYWPDGGFTTLIGDRADLRSVELLFNSLLVQATAAMTRVGSVSAKRGKSQTRSFRQSFLASFAMRIGERLRESAEDTAREYTEETGTDLVPVMRQRDQRVDSRTEELFPRLKFGRGTRITNYEGHIAGLAAADAARLTAPEPITRR
ncbi:DUF2786 domain-containing protein [Glycomyces algeriensis]|uniref:DUF2786 domain-containing protein n=1 Tax=Glycomyces algeriensis TaxID=256037 RepID=A0A9W6LFK4_9ACTN|nr:DUF2786 domain-containing protein [Glycomyces algeriensis]MDA1367618.1 DUF2786 domain-containing protein [Glycomyces algeriensis]MDR7353019.1 hypothetical protein [Glycomyces algeriensis]GLI40709.1 hypothetical protein GALLR39Z86_05590 [Glycomyces algeriensis]